MNSDEAKANQAGSETQPDALAVALKRAREAKQMSVRELQQRTGISPAVLYGYEAGRTKPGAKEIRALCLALSITPNALLFGDEQPFRAPESLADRLCKMLDVEGLEKEGFAMVAPLNIMRLPLEQKRLYFGFLITLFEARMPELVRLVEDEILRFETFIEGHEHSLDSVSALPIGERDQLLRAWYADKGEPAPWWLSDQVAPKTIIRKQTTNSSKQ